VSYFSFASQELDDIKTTLRSQLKNIAVLVAAGLGLVAINFFFPGFFTYPHLKWGGWESVARFWPLLIWLLVVSTLSACAQRRIRSSAKFTLFRWSLLVSTLAGLWEEVAYRWIYICYGMVAVIFANWLYGTWVAWILVILLCVATLALLSQGKFLQALPIAVSTGLTVWFALNANPIYWFYENVLVVIIHFTTFYQMDPVLYGAHDKLFIFGAITANAWFRDGHKYQGLIGFTNSWYVGMVLLYAALTYGLVTAIVIHILYDVVYDIVHLVFRPTT